MSSSFIISLDFELMWGVRDHRGMADYGDAVLGVRRAIPEILRRFQAAGIRATWATVGFLFARTREEILEHAPRVKPSYRNHALSPYAFIDNGLGRDEDEDPYHYAFSLVQRIADTDGQELATHTFSHYYCLEEGQTLEAFDADLKAAQSIAESRGHRLKTIVFPRNQMTDAHLEVCRGNGLQGFRGNAGGFAYRSRSGEENTALVRAVRLIDGVVTVSGTHSFDRTERRSGLVDVPASRFLRPWMRRAPVYSALHVQHVIREMRDAAQAGRHYHLWWHPHNMGRHFEQNIAQLDSVLSEFIRLRERYGMTSRNMLDLSQAEPVQN